MLVPRVFPVQLVSSSDRDFDEQPGAVTQTAWSYPAQSIQHWSADSHCVAADTGLIRLPFESDSETGRSWSLLTTRSAPLSESLPIRNSGQPGVHSPATAKMPTTKIVIATTGCVGLRMDFFIMNLASEVLCNQADIITERRLTGNGKSIQPVAPFLMLGSVS